jgi:hypothetical protein
MHKGAPYNPVKAHEYYIRTRQLKGRMLGRTERTKTSDGPLVKKAGSYTVKMPTGSSVKLTQQQLTEQRAYVAERISNIKKMLSDLNSQLKEKMVAATEAEAKSKKPPTAAEKADAARESKKYKAKNQQKLASKAKAAANKADGSKPKADTVDGLKRQISQVQGRLKAVVKKQRLLSSATKSG